jgi:HNH endonuclease/AP2 domain
MRPSNRYRGLCGCGEHAWAVLTKGYVTFVSPVDAALLAARNWHAVPDARDRLVYAEAAIHNKTTKRRHLRLHREIIGEQPFDVDHADHNGLNNRRGNLRLCTQSQNYGNGRHRVGVSGFRGVWRDKRSDRWRANIAGRKLGSFATAEEAAPAYDAAAIKRFGDFAPLNFPTSRSQHGGTP